MARSYQYNSADTETSDAAADYSKQQVTLTFTPDASSTYFILATWMMQQLTSTVRYIAGRVRNTTTPTTFQEYLYENHDNTEDYLSCLGLGVDTFGGSPASQTYAIEYKGENAAVAAKCKNARIIAIKKESADEYNESTGRSTTTSATPQDKATLTFTPGSQGDYIVIAAAGLDCSSASVDMGCMLDIDGTDYGVAAIRLVDTATNRYGWFFMKKVNLTAASHTIKIQYNSDGAATVGIQDARIIALRADTMDNVYADEETTRQTTTSSSYADTTVSITQTPENVDHLILGGALMDSSSASQNYYIQQLEGATQKWEQAHEVRATTNIYPTFGMYMSTLAASSTTFKLQVRRETSNTVGYDEASLIILQLEASAGGTLYTKDLDEIVTIVDTIAKLPSRTLIDAVVLVQSTANFPSRSLPETVTVVDTLTSLRTAFKSLTEAVPIVDTIIRFPSRVFTEVATIAETLAKYPQRLLTDVVTLVDTVTPTKVAVKSLTEAITLVESLVKQAGKSLVEAITIVDTKTTVSTLFRLYSETITIVETFAKLPSRAFTEVVTLLDTISRVVSRSLSQVITIVDTLDIGRSFARAYSEIVTITDSLSKFPSKLASETITLVESFVRSITRSIAEVVTVTDTLTTLKTKVVSLVEAISITDTLQKILVFVRSFTESISVGERFWIGWRSLGTNLWSKITNAISGWTQDTETPSGWTQNTQTPSGWTQDSEASGDWTKDVDP